MHNQSDIHHADVIAHRDSLVEEPLFTSDYIFDEVVTLALGRAGHQQALDIADYLLKSDITMLRTVSPVFSDAVALFRDHPVSFTDCATVALIRHTGIERLATFDTDFDAFDDITVVP